MKKAPPAPPQALELSWGRRRYRILLVPSPSAALRRKAHRVLTELLRDGGKGSQTGKKSAVPRRAQ